MSAVLPGADRLDELIVDHVSDVAAYCRWRCASGKDAQDAVSEVFVVAWRRLGEVPEGTAARVWLLAIARRVIADDPGARGRRSRSVERLRSDATGDRAQWPVEMAPGTVADALRRLDPADREILLLAEWEGLTSEEIGAVIGCLAVTARSRLHRARQRFRTVHGRVGTPEVRFSSPSPALPTAPPQLGATGWPLSEPAHDAQR